MIEPRATTKNIEVWIASSQVDNRRDPLYRANVKVRKFELHLTYAYAGRGLELSKGYLVEATTFSPTFEDLHAIIRCIAKCEDEKYKYVADPRQKLKEFLAEAVYETDFGKLARKYGIPYQAG